MNIKDLENKTDYLLSAILFIIAVIIMLPYIGIMKVLGKWKLKKEHKI